MKRKFEMLQYSFLSAAFTLGACASSGLSQEQLTDTQATIRAADEVGANEPKVALHLRYARDQLEVAKQLIRDDDEREAQRMLDRAQTDAELALALARSQEARQAAQEAWTEVEDLREQAR